MDAKRRSVLHHALSSNDEEFALKILNSQKVDPAVAQVIMPNGLTLLEIAKQKGYKRTEKAL